MKFDEALIERGRRLHRLLDNEYFAVLLDEINERLEAYQYQIDAWDGTSLDSNAFLARARHRQGELKSLKDWIAETIEDGGAEKMRRDNFTQQSEKDLQFAQINEPA